MNKKYWKKYYEQHNAPMQASHFARFILNEYNIESGTMIELGCGNGRDSLYFARHGIHVLAIDQVDTDIPDQHKLPNLTYKCADFTKLGKMDPFDFVYSRFTLHSISEKEETEVIRWSSEHIKKGGKILIEARGRKNELYQRGDPIPDEPHAFIYENHYRRFIEMDSLVRKLVEAGFEVDIADEKSGFAPFGETDYVFMRIIATKKC